MPPPGLDVIDSKQQATTYRNEHVHKRLRVNISRTLEPLTSPLESTKRTHYPAPIAKKNLAGCSYVVKRCCYRTMDFAIAPSQNRFSNCTLFLQNKTYIIQKMTKNLYTYKCY
jgi:hypothetical protein